MKVIVADSFVGADVGASLACVEKKKSMSIGLAVAKKWGITASRQDPVIRA